MKAEAKKEELLKAEKKCEDMNCPHHSNLSIRGRLLKCQVVSDKMSRSVLVELPFIRKITKFERYEKRKTRLCAHNPDCINAKTGDNVLVQECRPISKTKSAVVIKVLKE